MNVASVETVDAVINTWGIELEKSDARLRICQAARKLGVKVSTRTIKETGQLQIKRIK